MSVLPIDPGQAKRPDSPRADAKFGLKQVSPAPSLQAGQKPGIDWGTSDFIDPPYQKIDSRFSQLESGLDLLGSGSIPMFCSGIYVQYAPRIRVSVGASRVNRYFLSCP